MKNFGILTLATESDYLKAVALAISLRQTNPGVPLAVACKKSLFQKFEGVFDHVIEEKPGIRGFVHKVYLDEYTPFGVTLFLDSDVVVFKALVPILEAWPDFPYTACGQYVSSGTSAFGLVREDVIDRLGLKEMVCIDGAGHALFRLPQASEIFERARIITADYAAISGGARYADEDVMNIAMSELGYVPASPDGFFSRYISGRPGSVIFDVSECRCSYICNDTGELKHPAMMHFAADEAPFAYGWLMYRLLRRAGIGVGGLVGNVIGDAFRRHVRLPINRFRRALTG